jgi:hypothetical protein
MSKFSVGQRVVASESWIERKGKWNPTIVFKRPVVGTIVNQHGETLLRLDDAIHSTPAIAHASNVFNKVGWTFVDEDLTPLHRFSVNDKVTIKRLGHNGWVAAVHDDNDRPYEVRVPFNIDRDDVYFVSDDDLDPHVEPATPATADDNPRLIALIEERLAKGFASYGHGVQTGDRQYDWPTMTLEEMLDGAIYLAAAIVHLQDADRQHRIDSHYIAVARELATINGWTITNALDALVIAGFASDFYRDPDVYLHVMPRELAKVIDEKRKGAR